MVAAGTISVDPAAALSFLTVRRDDDAANLGFLVKGNYDHLYDSAQVQHFDPDSILSAVSNINMKKH
ncbi:hypothetical protein BIW11_04924 [Tropilaelaps mercedesae]|uniref:Uncharacterized protein n=1 Tax=Tropilaelaps mercedesae TaxID=418985 RepID=A0A1V9X037_9ACAR|nr:hypothetical protein BIW11_04924 [Tropilaelaps mercedesae]